MLIIFPLQKKKLHVSPQKTPVLSASNEAGAYPKVSCTIEEDNANKESELASRADVDTTFRSTIYDNKTCSEEISSSLLPSEATVKNPVISKIDAPTSLETPVTTTEQEKVESKRCCIVM